MKELKDIISESLDKEYGYKIKVARDCSNEDLAKLESIIDKHNTIMDEPVKNLKVDIEKFKTFKKERDNKIIIK